MIIECINVNALVSIQQPRTFGDWDGHADPLPSGLRGRGGQNTQRDNGRRESEAHSRKTNVTEESQEYLVVF